MSFLDSDVIRVLEDVLPARFGGLGVHYQVIEGHRPGGGAEVRLLVDPAVGPLDADEIRRVFLAELGRGPDPRPAMGIAWRETGLVTVERRRPLATRSGKILHVHQDAAS
jgi:hypothetical protein